MGSKELGEDRKAEQHLPSKKSDIRGFSLLKATTHCGGGGGEGKMMCEKMWHTCIAERKKRLGDQLNWIERGGRQRGSKKPQVFNGGQC